MTTTDLAQVEGQKFPAGRTSRNLVGGRSSIQAKGFCMGHVTLDPNGGQVPWHNHPQEEVYVLLHGKAEMCVGNERRVVSAGQAVYIPEGAFHQLTNIGSEPAVMLYCYAPAGDVAHWRQELDGTLPVAGVDAPPLPDGAKPQCTSAGAGSE